MRYGQDIHGTEIGRHYHNRTKVPSEKRYIFGIKGTPHIGKHLKKAAPIVALFNPLLGAGASLLGGGGIEGAATNYVAGSLLGGHGEFGGWLKEQGVIGDHGLLDDVFTGGKGPGSKLGLGGQGGLGAITGAAGAQGGMGGVDPSMFLLSTLLQGYLGSKTADKNREAAIEAGAAERDAALEAARLQYEATQDAIELQKEMYETSLAEQTRQYNQGRQDQLPWLQTGKWALEELADKMAMGPDLDDPRFNEFAYDPSWGLDRDQAGTVGERWVQGFDSRSQVPELTPFSDVERVVPEAEVTEGVTPEVKTFVEENQGVELQTPTASYNKGNVEVNETIVEAFENENNRVPETTEELEAFVQDVVQNPENYQDETVLPIVETVVESVPESIGKTFADGQITWNKEHEAALSDIRAQGIGADEELFAQELLKENPMVLDAMGRAGKTISDRNANTVKTYKHIMGSGAFGQIEKEFLMRNPGVLNDFLARAQTSIRAENERKLMTGELPLGSDIDQIPEAGMRSGTARKMLSDTLETMATGRVVSPDRVLNTTIPSTMFFSNEARERARASNPEWVVDVKDSGIDIQGRVEPESLSTLFRPISEISEFDPYTQTYVKKQVTGVAPPPPGAAEGTAETAPVSGMQSKPDWMKPQEYATKIETPPTETGTTLQALFTTRPDSGTRFFGDQGFAGQKPPLAQTRDLGDLPWGGKGSSTMASWQRENPQWRGTEMADPNWWTNPQNVDQIRQLTGGTYRDDAERRRFQQQKLREDFQKKYNPYENTLGEAVRGYQGDRQDGLVLSEGYPTPIRTDADISDRYGRPIPADKPEQQIPGRLGQTQPGPAIDRPQEFMPPPPDFTGDLSAPTKPRTGRYAKDEEFLQKAAQQEQMNRLQKELPSLDIQGMVSGQRPITPEEQNVLLRISGLQTPEQQAQQQGQPFDPMAPFYERGFEESFGYQADDPRMRMRQPGQFETDPGYEFRRKQGEQALERSLAARGQALSGQAAKAAQEYGQGLAAQEYGNWYQRERQAAMDAERRRQNAFQEYLNAQELERQRLSDWAQQRAGRISEIITQKGLAAEDRQRALDEYYRSLTPYQSMAGVGQSTAGQTASQGGQYASNLANLATGYGQSVSHQLQAGAAAQGQGQIGAGSATAGQIMGSAAAKGQKYQTYGDIAQNVGENLNYYNKWR